MSRRPRRRSRPVLTDPLSLLRPVAVAERERVMARFRSSLETMARGSSPTEEEWRDLSDVCNTLETLTLIQRKLAIDEVMPSVRSAVDAMVAAAKRYREGKGLRLDGPGLEAMREVLAIYEQCLEGFTEREMALAQQETQRRINALLRSKNPSSEVICI